MEREKQAWENWFASHEITPMRLDYRQIETDINAVLRLIATRMNLPLRTGPPQGVEMKKPGDRPARNGRKRCKAYFQSELGRHAMSLTLYSNPMSRGRIVRWALEEIGAPYDFRTMDYGPPMKAAEFCALNPMGKIPVLCHDGVTVTETAAILAYLADYFPQAELAPPPGSTERGAYYRWLFFGAGPVEAAITNQALGVEVPPDKAVFVGYGSFALVLDVLEQAVSAGPYLAGGKFSAADIYVASQLGFGLRFGSIAARPAFQDYTTRMMSRPAAQRANALDDALMPAQT